MRRRSSQTLRELCYYKWEFLRRNAEYQKDYKKFLEICRKNEFNPKAEWVQHEAYEKDPAKQKRLKYGIAFLENPEKHILIDRFEENPFWPLIEDRGLKRPTWPSVLKPLYPKGEPVITIHTDQFKKQISAPLALIIDLTHPKGQILAQVKKLVDDAIEERKKLKIVRSRKQLSHYEDYLKAWDLRQQGKTFKEIAKQHYPKEFETAPEVAIKMARTHVKEADKLIKRGYRQIR